MGGHGSGIRGGQRKPNLENVRRLSMKYLNKSLVLFAIPEWQRMIRWSQDGETVGTAVVWSSRDGKALLVQDGTRRHEVVVQWTPCRFGGKRPWFRCPVCGRRCTVLVISGRQIGCRVCLRLPYAVQRETRLARVRRRIDKIFARIPDGRRPKGMRRRTFARINTELARLSPTDTAALAARVDGFRRRRRRSG